jgi:diguanylate cyclase (GGDEF)-like protein
MSSQKPSVLVADDSLPNIELLEAVLGRDYELLFATNGKDAVEIALAETPDLILLDVVMPQMDGFEACTRLKADRRTAEIPIIFITALNAEAEEARGLELGAIDFISKPFSLAVVQARVRNHLELKRQRDLLRGLSFLDGLTGIANRRRFDQFLDMEWRRGIRSQEPLSLILMDIDFFKNFNDSVGHLAGDDCLKHIARCLAEVVQRPGDLAARYGGEEFACILSGTDAEGALTVAERILEGVVAMALPHPASKAAPCVTLSIGVATKLPLLEAAPESLIDMADKALYRAKEAGRNRVVAGGS